LTVQHSSLLVTFFVPGSYLINLYPVHVPYIFRRRSVYLPYSIIRDIYGLSSGYIGNISLKKVNLVRSRYEPDHQLVPVIRIIFIVEQSC